MRKVLPFFLALLVIAGCKQKTCSDKQDISGIQLSVTVEPLENELFAVADTSQLARFLETNPVIAREFFYELNYPSKDVMLSEVFKLIKSPDMDTLYRQVKLVYGNGENLQLQFEDAFKRIKYYYPEFEAPKVQTVVSGFGSDVYLTDSLIVIGLDYYLGDNSKYKPDLYEYLLERMTPEHLVPVIIMGMSDRFNKSDLSSQTMLDEMIFFGKTYHFMKTVMPCVSDHIIEGYSPQTSADIRVSEAFIWSYFVENQLLYDKNTLNLAKYVNERPGIPEIDPICPGRIGRWLGWRMVQQWEEREGEDLVRLMAMTNARDILMQSKYRPQSR